MLIPSVRRMTGGRQLILGTPRSRLLVRPSRTGPDTKAVIPMAASTDTGRGTQPGRHGIAV